MDTQVCYVCVDNQGEASECERLYCLLWSQQQAFEVFKVAMMKSSGSPFDWWCFTKITGLRNRLVTFVVRIIVPETLVV